MINEQISDREVRVIGTDGQQLGVMSSRDAQKLADEMSHVKHSTAMQMNY